MVPGTFAILALAASGGVAIQVDEWVHVRLVPKGSAVVLITSSGTPQPGFFLSADDNGLSFLNAPHDLPGDARRFLQRLAVDRSQDVEIGAKEQVEARLRLTKNGLFIGDQLAIPRAELVQYVARSAVTELRYDKSTNGSRTARDIGIGAGIGALAGYLIGSRCGPGGAKSECNYIGLVFAGFGAAIGAAVGVLAHLPTTPTQIIYVAPRGSTDSDRAAKSIRSTLI